MQPTLPRWLNWHQHPFEGSIAQNELVENGRSGVADDQYDEHRLCQLVDFTDFWVGINSK